MRRVILSMVLVVAAGFTNHTGWAATEEKEKGFLESLLNYPLEGIQQAEQSLEKTIFNLGDIRVSSARLSTPHADQIATHSPHNVTVIGAAEMEENGSFSLPEMLSQEEGVTYTDETGLGLNARVDLRGFGGEAKQALVLFDGVRAVEPVDNSVTWHLYPDDFLSRVEIQRGGGSTLYGEGALSGTILLKTKGPTKDFHINTENSWGDFHSEKHFVETSGTERGIGFYAGGRYQTIDGYRQNSDHEGVAGLLKLSSPVLEFGSIENSAYFADNETGIPGPLTAAEVVQNRRQKDPDGQFGDQFLDQLFQDSVTLTYYLEPISVEFSNLTSYRHRNQDSEQSFGGSFPGTSISEIKTETFANVSQAVWHLRGERYESSFSTGVEWSKDDIYNPSVFNGSFGPFRAERAIDRTMVGAFVQHQATLWDRWIVESGVRWDTIHWDIYDLLSPQLEKHKKASDWSPKAGLEYKLFDALSAYASYAETYKAPDSASLIFETPNIFTPNPDIDPQKAHHSEIGLRYFHPALGSIRADLFYVETKKEILFNDITDRNENFDTKRSGVEIANEIAVTKNAQVFFNYTFTDAIFDNGAYDGKEVPLVPRNKVSAGFLIEFFGGFKLSAQATGNYDQFALNDFNNLFPIEDYWTVGGKAAYKRDNWEIFVKVQNLLDEQYSAFTTSNGVNTVNYNPAPERYVEGGFRIEI